MSADPPAYLLSLQNNIRARPIPWDGAVRAGHISEAHLAKIRSADKVRKEQRRRVVEEDLPGFRALLLGGSDNNEKSVLVSAKKRPDVVQYMLVLTGDLIDGKPQLAHILLEHPTPYDTFLQFFSKTSNADDPIPLLATAVLTSLLSIALSSAASSTTTRPSQEQIEKTLPKMYAYLANLARSTDGGLQDIGVQEYSALLRNTRSRELFWEHREDTVKPMIDILRSAAGVEKNGLGNGNGEDGASTLWSGAAGSSSSSATVRSVTDVGIAGGVGLQLLYHVLLVLWQLSFEGSLVGEGLEREYEIIALYSTLLRLSPKEKTTRLLLSTLTNLLGASGNRSTLLPIATVARLPSVLQNLRGRHYTDPDLLEDLNGLDDLLSEYTRTQTTFDEYAAEVRAGHLRWSPPHRNPSFWHENARRIIEENQNELPKKLAEILGKSWEADKQVLAVACNDVGCLVKEVPEMRARLEKLGLKARVMALMAERDDGVRWESLRALGEWLRYHFD
ncbi:MAG: H(+)-transporting V1 sector ATPase subunit H [Peltula sp. TS41687]|nr:MAG: H(+)-transporting V1 sector ATPase subunit H [Peltula sp. TS41687]